MTPFDFESRTRIVFGPNRIDALGELARELGAARAMIVTDPGVIAAGHAPRGVASLEAAGLATFVYDRVRENPTTLDVRQATDAAKGFRPDLLVGLGGGSAMDCAKGVNFLLTNGGKMQDYWGVGKATKPMLPMIAAPTTTGTGSEMQSFALISDEQTHVKMACGDKKAACRVALLDPTLTVTQPRRVAALTGIDAISHAVETYVTLRRNPGSLLYSREAWRLLAGSFVRTLREPNDLEARGAMQLGAAFAGQAIENSMLGAAHALANPLTAVFDVTHGQAVGVMLPAVVRFNGQQFGRWYRELLEATAELPGIPSPHGGADGLAGFLTGLLDRADLQTRLSDLGVERAYLPQLAEQASRQWTGQFNPRPVDQRTLLELYEETF